jgi:hypothetical protein
LRYFPDGDDDRPGAHLHRKTFLNPLVPFGLAAAAIAVLLHLLNLRKVRTVDFSTLTFPKELQQSRIRRLKLQQILLLLVRRLKVVYMMLAFARPALRGNLPAGTGSTAGSSVRLLPVDAGGDPLPNAAADSVVVLSRIFERNRPVEVSVAVGEEGDLAGHRNGGEEHGERRREDEGGLLVPAAPMVLAVLLVMDGSWR